MNYDKIKIYLEKPVLKIFRMENPAILISFLFQEFKAKNEVTIREDLLIEKLKSHLLGIEKKNLGDAVPQKNSELILTDWANLGFFRKFYVGNTDLAFYELTPSSEKIINYIQDLDKKDFVGTESRLLKIFEILKEISFRSSDDPNIRIQELEKRKQQIESEIEEIKSGNLKKFTSTQVKERYFDLFDTARRLLSDFREVEYNFREIDSLVRSAKDEGSSNRGKFLSQFFEKEDFLFETDQGKSFIAFFEFLMSQEKQTELTELISMMLALPEIIELEKNSKEDSFNREFFFRKLKSLMMNECMKVNKTNSKISEGLRKFIAAKTYLENKRLGEMIAEIKQQASALRDISVSKDLFFEIDNKPRISLIMERPLFSPPDSIVLNDSLYLEGDDANYTQSEIAMLYNNNYIDKEKLKANINECLRYKSQISLKEIIEKFPTEKGLLDVVGYFSLMNDEIKSILYDDKKDTLVISSKESGKKYKITIPNLVFIKDE
ncbi:MAG: DUF3375 domain-containing protein [Leptospiraceae bacterium]|nr:DUF3375 domain-containing protein [Leptospiraceae bacterium]